MTLKYCIEDLLATDSENQFIGYLNLLCSESCAVENKNNFIDISSSDILKKIHILLKTGYFSIFFKYRNFNGSSTRIWGVHHLILCVFLHENNYKFGAYSWGINESNGSEINLIIPFWFKCDSTFKLDYFDISPKFIETKEDSSDIFIDPKTIANNVAVLWDEYTDLNVEYNNPLYRNLYSLIIYSSLNSISSFFNPKSLNLHFNIDHLLLCFNFSFFNIVDSIFYELNSSEGRVSVVNKSDIVIEDVSDSDVDDISFEYETTPKSDIKINEAVTTNTNNVSNKYEASFLIEQNKQIFNDNDLLHYIKNCSIFYARHIFNIESLEPTDGFYIGVLEYISKNTILIKKKVSELKLNYLKFEFTYSISYLLAKTYIFKYFYENYMFLVFQKDNVVLEDRFKKIINDKVRSIGTCLKNKIDLILEISPEYFRNFNAYQIIYYYFKYFSDFISNLSFNNYLLSKDDLDRIFNEEINKIENLDSSFFYYLTEYSPRQIYLIKN